MIENFLNSLVRGNPLSLVAIMFVLVIIVWFFCGD